MAARGMRAPRQRSVSWDGLEHPNACLPTAGSCEEARLAPKLHIASSGRLGTHSPRSRHRGWGPLTGNKRREPNRHRRTVRRARNCHHPGEFAASSKGTKRPQRIRRPLARPLIRHRRYYFTSRALQAPCKRANWPRLQGSPARPRQRSGTSTVEIGQFHQEWSSTFRGAFRARGRAPQTR